MEFTEDDAKEWTARMKNADGSTGPQTYDLVERAQAVITPTAARKDMMEEYVTRKEFDELLAKLPAPSVRPRKIKEADIVLLDVNANP